jgi:hypothetical protein
LKVIVKNIGVSCGLSPHIENNTTALVSECMVREIKKRSETAFVLLIVDEGKDISMKAQVSYVLRYESENGDAENRF